MQRRRIKPCVLCGDPAATVYSTLCLPCRERKHREAYDRQRKHILTPERKEFLLMHYASKPGVPADVARRMDVPQWVAKNWASQLGIAKRHPATIREWTPEEENILLTYAGVKTVGALMRMLHRSRHAVHCKMSRMKLRARLVEGYTMRELAMCFGCNDRKVQSWLRQGWITATRRGTNNERDPYYFTEEGILKFVAAHPMAFSLVRVDQLWFMDLILSGGLVRKAIQNAEQIDKEDFCEDTTGLVQQGVPERDEVGGEWEDSGDRELPTPKPVQHWVNHNGNGSEPLVPDDSGY